MLAQTRMAVSLRTSQSGGALIVNCMGVEPPFCLCQKIKFNGDTSWSEGTRNTSLYGFYSSLPVPISGQISFKVEVTVADCKELGIPRV